MSLWIIFFVIFVALAFEYINGFHDTANSIATVVGTKVLTPRQAIMLAAVTNLLGALLGHAVAKTVSSGLVDSTYISPLVIACALLGGITWNLITWWFGLPSSSTHALVGGICGAALASSHGNWKSILWSVEKIKDGKPVMEGVYHKVIVPMVTSPLIGFVGGFLIMGFFYLILRNARPRFVNRFFGKAQIVSAGFMGFAHGLADAQKTMGVITLALVTATSSGTFNTLPNWCSFLKMEKNKAADVAITTLAKKDASVDEIKNSAKVLEQEAAVLSNGEFRESFFTLAAKSYEIVGDSTAAAQAAASAKDTHEKILHREASRVVTKIPLLGGMLKAKVTDWKKVLESEMTAASAKGKAPLAAATGKVKDLSPDVPVWIKVVCALTMAAGTAAGGWKIIKTLGHKMVKLQPVHGFAAETTAATLLAVTQHYGMTVSTTHAITTSIMGVGCAKRFNALNIPLVERIIWAWVLTLPCAGAVGYGMVKVFQFVGWLS